MLRGNPELTVDELLENDEDDEYSLSEEEVQKGVKETNSASRGMEATFAMVTFSRMFRSGYLTAAEFHERVEEVEEYARNEDDVRMP